MSAGRAAHLILVGLPGVGKSTVGAGVAALLGIPFLDFDVEIERRAGMSVAEIFRVHGEAHFRGLERALTEELATAPPMVLAPGGGWMSQPGLAALLRPPGRIIYLAASPAAVARRLGPASGARPLLAGGEPVERLAALLATREAAYRGADVVLNTELIDVQQVIHAVGELAPTSGGR
ncbi:MAG TPA: shikimate kinase [Gemmatimonadaceae bacterium]|nr:shikimate kinase [Gemmatimonadaceae bacterium]